MAWRWRAMANVYEVAKVQEVKRMNENTKSVTHVRERKVLERWTQENKESLSFKF